MYPIAAVTRGRDRLMRDMFYLAVIEYFTVSNFEYDVFLHSFTIITLNYIPFTVNYIICNHIITTILRLNS